MKVKEALMMRCPFSGLKKCVAHECVAWRVVSDSYEVEDDGEISYCKLPTQEQVGICLLIEKDFYS